MKTHSKRQFPIVRISPGEERLLDDVLTLFGDVFDEHETYSGARPSRAYTQALLASENFIALAATADSHVIGATTAYVLPKYERERCEIYIYDLAVREDCRRQGVATSLIKEICAIGATREAWTVFVQADYGDEPAIALYTKLGAREDVMHFDIAVSLKD